MKAITQFLFALTLFISGATVRAQSFRDNRQGFSNDNRGERQSQYASKIESTKENYIISQLQLSPDEADRFMPVYRQYQQEVISIRRQKRKNNSSEQSNGNDQINRELYLDQQLLEVKKRYNGEFLKILSPQKVSMLYKSERQFNDELIRQMGERRGQPD